MLTAAQTNRLFKDSGYSSYFYGSDFLNAQPPSIVPDEWDQDFDKWNSEEVRRFLFDLHVAFLESLFDQNGYAVLYRAMDKHPKIRSGDVVNLGQFWTYSGDANLCDAQVSSGSNYKTGFAALVHESQVDWPQTIADHTGRWDGEKQIFVKGPVEVVDVFPISQWRTRTKSKSFVRWTNNKLSLRNLPARR